METDSYKIIIVDDHTIVEALALRLSSEEGIEVMADFSSGEKAIEFCRHEKPDIVIVDYNLNGINGIETIVKIKTFYPSIPSILLSMFSNSIVNEAKMANIKWVINKAEDSDVLVRAIRYVKEGKDYLNLSSASFSEDSDKIKSLSKEKKRYSLY